MKVSEEKFSGYKLVWPTEYHKLSETKRAELLATLANQTGGKVIGSVVKVKV